MQELKSALEDAGYKDVVTYIQSGNVLLDSPKSATAIAKHAETLVSNTFGVESRVAVFTTQEWLEVVDRAPSWWGHDNAWKHNLIAPIPPISVADTINAIGELKPDIERIAEGQHVLYQSLSWQYFGRTTSGKLASNSIYKQVTIRNYNTSIKLSAMLKERGKH